MIEPGVHHKILSDGIRDRPQIADRIPVCEWLREMPDFAGHC